MRTKFGIALLLVVSLVIRSFGQDRIRLERRLPEETCFLASVTNITDFRKRLDACSYGRLIKDPELAPVRKAILDNIAKTIRDTNLPNGIDADTILGMPSGEMAIAVLTPHGPNVPILFCIDCQGAADGLKKLVSSIQQTVGDDEEYQVVRHGGVGIHVIQAKSGDRNPGQAESPPAQSAIFVKDEFFVSSNSLDAAKSLIDGWNPRDKSLAKSEAFSYIQSESRNDDGSIPSVTWYFDFNRLINGVLEGVPNTDIATNMIRGNLPKFGLDAFKAIGGSIELGSKRYDMISKTIGRIDQPTTGLLAVLQFPEERITLPKWAPRGIIGVSTLNWDLEGAYAAARELTNELIGRGNFDKAINGLANDPKGPRVHIKLDILDQLSGKLFVIQSPGRIENNLPVEGPTLLAAEVNEAVQASQTLDRLLSRNDEFESRDFEGTRIFSSKEGGIDASFAIAHNCLIVSDDPKMIEKVVAVDDPSKGFISDKRYERLLQQLPGRSSMVAIQEESQQIGVLYELFRTGGPVPLPLKVPKLPPFEKLRHHFLPSAAYITPTKKGFKHVGFSLQQTVGE